MGEENVMETIALASWPITFGRSQTG